jgi:competence protein CoiA
MLYAETSFGQKQLALPESSGLCPTCKQSMVAKCGRIRIWHWSHQKGQDCDPWFEPETGWHVRWKSHVVASHVEVTIANHRADLVTSDGMVVELQHSPISPSVIEEREKFYDNMLWIVDASQFVDHLQFSEKDKHYTFRWKWARSCWGFATKPVYLDIGNGCLFEIKKIHPGSPRAFKLVCDTTGKPLAGYYVSRKVCAGWGRFIRNNEFLAKHFPGLLRESSFDSR